MADMEARFPYLAAYSTNWSGMETRPTFAPNLYYSLGTINQNKR